MNNILLVLEEYIQQHKEKSKENYNNYVKMKEEVERLTLENTTLRNDLFELSKDLKPAKNKKTDGIWHLLKKEMQEPLDIIFYDGAVYENDNYRIEASRDKEYKWINIEVLDKNTNTKDYIDNEDYLKDVIKGYTVDFMDGELLRNFLINLNWIE